MDRYECRHKEWHDDHDWLVLKAYDASSAATEYASRLDARDSDAFTDPDRAQPILVREVGRPDTEAEYAVTFEYNKSFRARTVRKG